MTYTVLSKCYNWLGRPSSFIVLEGKPVEEIKRLVAHGYGVTEFDSEVSTEDEAWKKFTRKDNGYVDWK